MITGKMIHQNKRAIIQGLLYLILAAASAVPMIFLISSALDTRVVNSKEELVEMRFGLPIRFITEDRSRIDPPFPYKISLGGNIWEDPIEISLPLLALNVLLLLPIPLLAIWIFSRINSRQRILAIVLALLISTISPFFDSETIYNKIELYYVDLGWPIDFVSQDQSNIDPSSLPYTATLSTSAKETSITVWPPIVFNTLFLLPAPLLAVWLASTVKSKIKGRKS